MFSPAKPCSVLGAASIVRHLVSRAALGHLSFVTAGAESVTADQAAIRTSGSVIAGLAKVAALEHPELGCLHIDLDPASKPDASLAFLLHELDDPGSEKQIAIRSGARYVPRLRPMVIPPAHGLSHRGGRPRVSRTLQSVSRSAGLRASVK